MMACWYCWGVKFYFYISSHFNIFFIRLMKRLGLGYIHLWTMKISLIYLLSQSCYLSSKLHSLFLNNSFFAAWISLSFFACSKKIPYTRVLSISSRTPVMDVKLLSFKFVFLFLSVPVFLHELRVSWSPNSSISLYHWVHCKMCSSFQM